MTLFNFVASIHFKPDDNLGNAIDFTAIYKLMSKPTKEDLIRLVSRIQNESGCIVDLDALINKFEQSVPNPTASQWIFDPPDGKRKTPAEVVEIALSPEL